MAQWLWPNLCTFTMPHYQHSPWGGRGALFVPRAPQQQCFDPYGKQHDESDIDRRTHIHNLYLQLAMMPSAEEWPRDSNNANRNIYANIQITAKKIRHIISELQKYGENVDQQRMLLVSILTKFPKPFYNFMMSSLNELPHDMRLSQVMTELGGLTHNDNILKPEYCSEDISAHPSNGQSRRISTYKDICQHGSNGHPTWNLYRFFSDTATQSEKTKHEEKSVNTTGVVQLKQLPIPAFVTKPCTFCHGTHFNAKCPQYRTSKQRKSVLVQQKKCFRCFGNDHAITKCTKPPRVCFNCGELGHHRLLCKHPDTWTKKQHQSTSKPMQKPNEQQVIPALIETMTKIVDSFQVLQKVMVNQPRPPNWRNAANSSLLTIFQTLWKKNSALSRRMKTFQLFGECRDLWKPKSRLILPFLSHISICHNM